MVTFYTPCPLILEVEGHQFFLVLMLFRVSLSLDSLLLSSIAPQLLTLDQCKKNTFPADGSISSSRKLVDMLYVYQRIKLPGFWTLQHLKHWAPLIFQGLMKAESKQLNSLIIITLNVNIMGFLCYLHRMYVRNSYFEFQPLYGFATTQP